jgi:hypothetical protein
MSGNASIMSLIRWRNTSKSCGWVENTLFLFVMKICRSALSYTTISLADININSSIVRLEEILSFQGPEILRLRTI